MLIAKLFCTILRSAEIAVISGGGQLRYP